MVRWGRAEFKSSLTPFPHREIAMSEGLIVATVHAPARARNAIGVTDEVSGMLGMLSGHDPSRRTVALDVVPETHLDFRVGSSMRPAEPTSIRQPFKN